MKPGALRQLTRNTGSICAGFISCPGLETCDFRSKHRAKTAVRAVHNLRDGV